MTAGRPPALKGGYMSSVPYPRRATAARLAAGAAIAALVSGMAEAAPGKRLDLPAGPLETALSALARQTGQELLYTPDLVRGRKVAALHGDYSPEEALRRLLASADDAVVVRTAPNVLVIKTAADRPSGAGERGAATAPRPFAPDASEQGVTSTGAAATGRSNPMAAGPTPEEASRLTTVEALQVTGSHIRGGGDPASPLVVLDRADLDRSGYGTVAGALNVLPQNFSGQATEATVATRTDTLGTNASYATSVNLRGLGADATLVLVDGRRLAGSGLRGDFTDLSTVPTIAVRRVEVLLDGASAVYGSDAVGGVVNVLLRRDLDGGEVRAEAGVGQGGHPWEAQEGAVFGRLWSGGGIIAAYERQTRGALAAQDRSFAASADLRPFGGGDRRSTFAYPGNILGRDPGTGASVPLFGIPAGQNGTGLTPASFAAGVLNLSSPQTGADLLPDQRAQSGFLAVHQALGDLLEVSGSLRIGARRARAAIAGQTAFLSVTRADPFYVSPVGAASELIQYSFEGQLGNPIAHAMSQSLGADLGATLKLPGDWEARSYVGSARVRESNRTTGLLQSVVLAEALGNSPDRPQTPFNAAVDGFFNPFTGSAGGNTPGVLAGLGSGHSRASTRTETDTADLEADGRLFRLPAGPVRLALGVQARRERFDLSGWNYTGSLTPVPSTTVKADRDVTAAFAELQAPLVSEGQGAPLIRRLDLSAAIRTEHYSDFGRTTDPRAGLVWSPLEGLLLRATYGKSFRAPALQQLRSPALNGPALFPQAGGGTLPGLLLQGGNPNLRPETASTWTAGADFRPSSDRDLHLSVTWFRTTFRNRIDQPVRANLPNALTDPTLASFVHRISPATNAADLALITALLADPATTTSQGVFPATSFGAIVDVRYINTSRLEVSGWDVSADKTHDLFQGRLRLSGQATYLDTYQQQATPTAPVVSRVGIVAFPARLRARASADWTRGPVEAQVAINRTSAFKTTGGVAVDAFTSADAQLGLTGPDETPWRGLRLTLNVRNLFDARPPFYDNPLGYGFDAANADVIGRFVSLRITRSW